MAVMQVSNVRLAGLASAVPEGVATLADDAERFGQTNGDKISESLGLRSRRVVSGSMCASDLCHAAAEKLLEELGWDRSTVQALIFVSQTPDYVSPASRNRDAAKRSVESRGGNQGRAVTVRADA
jgi:3-oxoacyl-[acyl-carrier-protein] synthase III